MKEAELQAKIRKKRAIKLACNFKVNVTPKYESPFETLDKRSMRRLIAKDQYAKLLDAEEAEKQPFKELSDLDFTDIEVTDEGALSSSISGIAEASRMETVRKF